MFFRFPYLAEEILRMLASILGPEDNDLILIALDRDRREDGMVDGCARLRIAENGAALTPLMVIPDDGSPDEPGLELPDGDEEEPDEASYEEDQPRDRRSRPFTNIRLPADLMSDLFPHPMTLEVNRAGDGVTVSFGDGGSTADIIYLNSGERPVKVDGEALTPGEYIRVRSPGRLEDLSSLSGPERMRVKREKEEPGVAQLLSDPPSLITASQDAVARYLAHAGMPDATQRARERVNSRFGEVKELLKKVEGRTRFAHLPRRLSDSALARCRVSLSAGLFAARMAYGKLLELQKAKGEEHAELIARNVSEGILREYLGDEEYGDILLMLLDKFELLELI